MFNKYTSMTVACMYLCRLQLSDLFLICVCHFHKSRTSYRILVLFASLAQRCVSGRRNLGSSAPALPAVAQQACLFLEALTRQARLFLEAIERDFLIGF